MAARRPRCAGAHVGSSCHAELEPWNGERLPEAEAEGENFPSSRRVKGAMEKIRRRDRIKRQAPLESAAPLD